MIIKQVQSDTVVVDYTTSANCSEEIVQHSVVYKLIMLFKKHSLFSQKNKNIVYFAFHIFRFVGKRIGQFLRRAKFQLICQRSENLSTHR